MYLEPTAFVADFGLKVALNSVDDRKLKRLDIANLGEAIKGVTQSASQRHFDTFGVDEALELVRKLSGEVRDDELGSSVTGSNSLKINSEMSFDEIPELAEQALNNFQSNNYRNTSFRVIDKIQPELDSTRIVALDELAARSIVEGKSEFELGLPEISVSDFSSFSFAGFRHRNSYPDLQLTHYTSLLGAQLSALDSSALKRHRVRAEHLNNENIYSTLRVYDALIGSLEMDGARYAINEGKWYKIDSAFKSDVDRVFQDSVQAVDVIIPPFTRLSEDGRKQYLEPEKDYNSRYALARQCVLLDRILFDVPGVERSSFELCDLLDIQRKRLIHVKMSGRRSSILSHFFKQGTNSATLIKSVDGFWTAAEQRMNEVFGNDCGEDLRRANEESALPWTVEFHIADAPGVEGNYNIPFFSRVTFREERTRIRTMGFNVAVRFLPKPTFALR